MLLHEAVVLGSNMADTAVRGAEAQSMLRLNLDMFFA
jgi:hypothetical protein